MRHPCIGMTSALHAVRRDGPRPACQAQWSRLWSGHDATVAAPHRHASSRSNARCKPHFGKGGNDPDRSEEHTSELQSLMRISYAVFCLKQKKKKQNQTKHIPK